MSQENVEVVRRAGELTQEGVRRGDHGAAFDKAVLEGLIAPGMKIAVSRSRSSAFPELVGRNGYVEVIRSWTEDFDDFVFELEELIDAGNDRVVGIARWRGTGKGSRVPIEMHVGEVLTLEAGRIVRADFFPDPNHAFRAAGLRE